MIERSRISPSENRKENTRKLLNLTCAHSSALVEKEEGLFFFCHHREEPLPVRLRDESVFFASSILSSSSCNTSAYLPQIHPPDGSSFYPSLHRWVSQTSFEALMKLTFYQSASGVESMQENRYNE